MNRASQSSWKHCTHWSTPHGTGWPLTSYSCNRTSTAVPLHLQDYSACPWKMNFPASVLLTERFLLSGISKGQLLPGRGGSQELRVTPAQAVSSPLGRIPQHLNTAGEPAAGIKVQKQTQTYSARNWVQGPSTGAECDGANQD